METPSDRLASIDRKRQLLDAALPLAVQFGFENVSRGMVAQAVGCSESLLSRYWTALEFRAALMQWAIIQDCLPVLAQGLAARHPIALDAPLELRQAAASSLVE